MPSAAPMSPEATAAAVISDVDRVGLLRVMDEPLHEGHKIQIPPRQIHVAIVRSNAPAFKQEEVRKFFIPTSITVVNTVSIAVSGFPR